MNTLPTTSKKKKSKSTNEARDFAIIDREDGIKNKLVITTNNTDLSEEAIEKTVFSKTVLYS